MAPYLGCGCGSGPSARSLPAALAAWSAFGPAIALGRLAAAIAVDFAVRRRRCDDPYDSSALAQLRAVVPFAALGAIAAQCAGALFGDRRAPAADFGIGAIAAFVMAPCGIGAVALAASVRGVLPAASAGFLCVSGIIDARSWLHVRRRAGEHDAVAYALAAIACALVAARGGAGMVHPKFAFALGACAITLTVLAYRHRADRCALLRIAPAIMVAGAVLTAPPPQYHATETSLSQAFAGERIDFTGEVTQSGKATTLVRYAITCCRADAAPIVVRFSRAMPNLRGWAHAQGVLVTSAQGLALDARRVTAVPPPADPFVYR